MISRELPNIKHIKLFDICVRILFIFLPFTTLITVIGKVKIGLPFIGFYKEALILILGIILIWNIVKKNIRIKLSNLDWIIVLYIGYLTIVSFFTTGMTGIIYGGRYDFSFLILFLIVYHGFPLLREGISYYIKLALFSCGIMIFLSALLKYPFSEDLLLYVGFSGNPSAWDFSGVPPIFHGIDGANVRRFQGILDNPNTMGAFLVMFIGIFTYYFRGFKSWYYVNGCVILGLIVLVFYTYSRSALIGVVGGIGIVMLGSIGYIYKKYKKESILLSMITLFLVGITYIQYSDRIAEIVGRAGSTQGHFERMVTGYERFMTSPLGQGLGSAGPGYRYVEQVQTLDRIEREEKDRFYIPESWYIQQFIEGGIVGGVCFIILMGILCVRLFRKHIFLGGMFVGVSIMNLFLHTFESSSFSLLFFALIGIILGSQHYEKRVIKHR